MNINLHAEESDETISGYSFTASWRDLMERTHGFSPRSISFFLHQRGFSAADIYDFFYIMEKAENVALSEGINVAPKTPGYYSSRKAEYYNILDESRRAFYKEKEEKKENKLQPILDFSEQITSLCKSLPQIVSDCSKDLEAVAKENARLKNELAKKDSELNRCKSDYQKLQEEFALFRNNHAGMSRPIVERDDWAASITYENVVDHISTIENDGHRDVIKSVFQALLPKTMRTKFNKDIKEARKKNGTLTEGTYIHEVKEFVAVKTVDTEIQNVETGGTGVVKH